MRPVDSCNQSDLNQYVVFRAGFGQFIVNASNPVQAVQSVIICNDGVAADWVCHDLATYNPKLRQRVLETSETL